MIAHGSRQHDVFQIAPDANHIGNRMGMIDTLDGLIDDRPLVEVGGDIVRGRTDNFYTTIKRLLVGFSALKARQERVMNINASPGQALTSFSA